MPLSNRAALGGGGDEIVWAKAQRPNEHTKITARNIAVRIGSNTAFVFRRIAKQHVWKNKMRENNALKAYGEGPQKKEQKELPLTFKGRRQLIQKLEKTVGREIAAIDARLKKFAARNSDDSPGIDHERHARALATLARTLRELAAIERAELQAFDAQMAEDEDDDFPRDADTLRATLAQRLEQLSQEREASPFPGEL